MTDRVKSLLASASELALRDPDAALRAFAEAAELARATGSADVADGLEAMGRVAFADGRNDVARAAFELAEREATVHGNALVLARSRAALATIVRAVPYPSSADALAAEVRFAADALEAAHISLAPAPHLHGVRTRLELRRRMPMIGGLPAIGRIEIALGLDAADMVLLAACAALAIEADLDRLVPPAALAIARPTWSDVAAAWLAPAIDLRGRTAADALARLVRWRLVDVRDDGRPELAPDVQSLLAGRRQPAMPDGFARVTGTPAWNEGTPRAPTGPRVLPRVLAIVGDPIVASDHALALAWARGRVAWIARPQRMTAAAAARGVRALAREAHFHDRLLGLVIDALEPDVARAAIGEADALAVPLLVIAPHAGLVDAPAITAAPL